MLFEGFGNVNMLGFVLWVTFTKPWRFRKRGFYLIPLVSKE